jgi:hypothetical protein
MSVANAPNAHRPPVGRDAELALVRGIVDRVAVHGSAIVLTGDAGCGKSVLLQEGIDHGRALGVRVLRAAGTEFEADVAFAGLDLLLRSLSDDLEALAPQHALPLRAALGLATGPPPDRGVVADAVLAVLQSLARRTSVLVVVDDAHWLDRGTARVLSAVARRLEGTRIGLLVAVRTGADSFFDSSGLAELHLGPLDEGSSLALVDGAHPDIAPAVRRRIAEAAAGNPLALVELPLALTPAQRAGAAPPPSALPLGPRLERLFASRVARLPESARRLLLPCGARAQWRLRRSRAGRRRYAAAERADGCTSRPHRDRPGGAHGQLPTPRSSARRSSSSPPAVSVRRATARSPSTSTTSSDGPGTSLQQRTGLTSPSPRASSRWHMTSWAAVTPQGPSRRCFVPPSSRPTVSSAANGSHGRPCSVSR